MTRPTRMLIILGLFGVGSVIVLSLMAQRYGKIVQGEAPDRPPRSGAAEPAPPVSPAAGGGGSIESQARALRNVDAFIEVRGALAAAGAEDDEALDRALDEAGLDRATYDGILKLYADWKAGGAELSGPLPVAFERRREELLALE